MAIVAIASVAAACGTRVEHVDVVAAAGGTPGEAAGLQAAGEQQEAGPRTAGGDPGAPAGEGGRSAAGVGTQVRPGDVGSGSSTGATPTGGGSSSEAPITIGTVGVLSGPFGDSTKPLAEAVGVWVRAVNASGGIDGHPVEHLVADDGGDPSLHRSLVQEFVEEHGVVAFVGNPEALSGEQSTDYLTGAGVPVIGSDGAGQWFYDSPVYFPQASHGDAFLKANAATTATLAVERGMPRLGIVTCAEAQVCRDAASAYSEFVSDYGAELVYSAEASVAQPDFTAECIGARSANAEVFVLYLDANSVSRIAASCARQGYDPVYSGVQGTILPRHADDPNLDGLILGTNSAPWFLSTTPALQEFHEAFATYAPNVELNAAHMGGWVAAKVFEAGIRGVDGAPTRERLLQSLWSISGDTMGGLTGPLRFSPGQPATPFYCLFAVEISGGAFRALRGADPYCFD